jgi:hypothetical protein
MLHYGEKSETEIANPPQMAIMSSKFNEARARSCSEAQKQVSECSHAGADDVRGVARSESCGDSTIVGCGVSWRAAEFVSYTNTGVIIIIEIP